MGIYKQAVQNIILNEASKKGQIVYGTRALNQQVPTHLKRRTVDYDIYTKKPELEAKKIADKLNKNANDNRFEVKKGNYGRTWKVKDKKTGQTVVDYTQPGRKPKTKTVLGVKYADTSAIKRKTKKILSNEANKYRFDKDLDTLQRIKKGEVVVW